MTTKMLLSIAGLAGGLIAANKAPANQPGRILPSPAEIRFQFSRRLTAAP